MKELDSPLGGEMSGHIFFKERWYGFDDGTYAGCRLLEILSQSSDPNAACSTRCPPASTPS
jgi:phosphomannomutase